MRPFLKNLMRALLVAIAIICVLVSYKTVKWKAYVWLPDYLRTTLTAARPSVEGPTHVVFLFADHYEPGAREGAADRNRSWLESYKHLADQHSDSYGRKPQHTWFYAYDQRSDEVMKDLTIAVRDGYGEIELQWHHANETNESFRVKLEEALDWFASYGAMVAAGDKTARRFGFVHGNWALDNSRGSEFCGVSRELDILREAGCYADFTFPSFGFSAQPSKTNSIYYCYDTDEAKSYDTGEDVVVGERREDAFMVFQGPLGLALSRQLFEYGDIAPDYPPSASRVDKWITARMGVRGRPEWVFVKIYTHGIQNRSVVLGESVDAMFTYLEEKYGRGEFRLHYVTAREAFNMVRAAEDGLSGDPDLFRDYEVPKPANRIGPSSP